MKFWRASGIIADPKQTLDSMYDGVDLNEYCLTCGYVFGTHVGGHPARCVEADEVDNRIKRMPLFNQRTRKTKSWRIK